MAYIVNLITEGGLLNIFTVDCWNILEYSTDHLLRKRPSLLYCGIIEKIQENYLTAFSEGVV